MGGEWGLQKLPDHVRNVLRSSGVLKLIQRSRKEELLLPVSAVCVVPAHQWGSPDATRTTAGHQQGQQQLGVFLHPLFTFG